MKVLNIDIETYSSLNLKKVGMYRYAECPDFTILLFSYSLDGGPVITIDLTNPLEEIPEDIIDMLDNELVIKKAYNAPFERTCLAAYFNRKMPARQWRCTMVKGSYAGLPMGLDIVTHVLGVTGKNKEGDECIKYFSIPCKATKANGGRTRNMPWHNWLLWDAYKRYNNQDVVAEMAVDEKLHYINISKEEQRLWTIDQEINDRGIRVDIALATHALEIHRQYCGDLKEEFQELTGIHKVGSTAKVINWIYEQIGVRIVSLKKDQMTDNRKAIDARRDIFPKSWERVDRMLYLRGELSKTSIAKYRTMLNAVCKDGRVRGMFQFNGANRTGRWAGRLLQLQNLVKNSMQDLFLARDLVVKGEFDIFRMIYSNVSDVLSQLIRTAFISSPGKTFMPCDFSAIEARIIAWYGDCRWRLEVFKAGGDIYIASAARMFKRAIESIGKKSPERGKGKVAELALGFGGGVPALENMDYKKEIPADEYQGIVNLWRAENPEICNLWKLAENAVKHVLRSGTPVKVKGLKNLLIYYRYNTLFIRLPSGRELAYWGARLQRHSRGENIVYWGMHQKAKKWCLLSTWGGKIIENIIQATARDCMGTAMLRLAAEFIDIVIHVHDEAVPDVVDSPRMRKKVEETMSASMPWATINGTELLTPAELFTTDFYMKEIE